MNPKIKIAEKWNLYIGRIWEELLKSFSLPKKGVVVEVAPGGVNKIGNGLAQYGFEGVLYIIESHPKALKLIVKQYKNILKKAKIIPVKCELRDSYNILPKKVDMIIANHPLDDILLAKSLNSNSFNKYFGNEYGTDPKKTKKFWENVVSNKTRLNENKKDIVEEWINLIKKTNPNMLILSQYRSYYFEKNKIPYPDRHGFSLLNSIRKKYKKNEINVPQHLVKRFIEDPKRWLILKNPAC